MKSRKERRAEAKENGTVFEPQYKTATYKNNKGEEIVLGGKPKTYEEAYGVGYERFNNKFVTIKEATSDESTEEKSE